MKSVIRILTALILVFGVGVTVPKMIQTTMIAQGDSREVHIDSLEATTNEVTSPADKNYSSQGELTSVNQSEIEIIDDNVTESTKDFPIKSAVVDDSVELKKTTSVKETTPSVEDNSTTVDKTSENVDTPTTDTTTSSNSTEKEPETPKSDIQKPVSEEPEKIALTYKDVSYTRWVTTPLNMRKGPGTEHSTITSIPTGEELKVSKLASNGWSEVSYSGKTGYVSSKYLSEIIVNKPTPTPTPTPEKVQETPQTKPTEQSPTPVPVKNTSPSYDAYKMYIGGKAITYKNGGQSKGQSIIDNNSNYISTWGGAATFSGTDGKNTHFIGHNPGIFSVMLKISNGNTIVVTDGNASPTTYKVTRIFKVDDYGTNPSDGENYYNYLASTRGGEVITLQTCLSSNLNLIIRAEKIN